MAAIASGKNDRAYRAKMIGLFLQMLTGQEECLSFDPALFVGFVEKVVVSGAKKDVRMRFVMMDGREYTFDLSSLFPRLS